MKLELLKYPHDALRTVCQPVEKITEELTAQIHEMIEVMDAHKGIGLAANQVGLLYRVFVTSKPVCPGHQVFINPIITERSGWTIGEEGCLSIPGKIVKVRRHRKITVAAFDETGQGFKLKLSGLQASMVQHEQDHLSAVLIIDRNRNFNMNKTLIIKECGEYKILNRVRWRKTQHLYFLIYNENREQYEVYGATQDPLLVPFGSDDTLDDLAWADAAQSLNHKKEIIMPPIIGFSTGCLTDVDFPDQDRLRAIVDLIASIPGVEAIELSALREQELPIVMAAIAKDTLCLQRFKYVSIHAPSQLGKLDDGQMVKMLEPAVERGIPIVLHPDAIKETVFWQHVGDLLCIENMDNRKKSARTVRETTVWFVTYPKAKFCFDLGHAIQVDGSGGELAGFLSAYGRETRQVHLSSVNTEGRHERIKMTYDYPQFWKTLRLMPVVNLPVILETPVENAEEMKEELKKAQDIFLM